MASEAGTVIHHSDVSTLPPVFQPAWKSPEKARDRFLAAGGDFFSPMKLDRVFEPADAPSPRPSAFTFRAQPPIAASTPMVNTRRVSKDGPPLTPGGAHVPLRLGLRYDARVRDGLEQLVEEHDMHADKSQVTDVSSLQNARQSKRLRMHSRENTPTSAQWEPRQRIPMAYRSTNADAHTGASEVAARAIRGTSQETPRAIRGASTQAPRSILRSAQHRFDSPSRSISFADERTPRAKGGRADRELDTHITPRTARLEHVLAELNLHSESPQAQRKANTPDRSLGDRSALSQASFRVTRERLVELLTDVAPWEPDWARLQRVDFRARRLESCIGLEDYVPNAEEVWLDHNRVAFAMGVPASVRVLTASSNCITELASFAHLHRLEVLDVSGNELTSLAPIADLTHLVELRAARNQITHLHGLERLERLEGVDVSDNLIGGRVDLEKMQWPRIATLRLARNALGDIEGLAALGELHTLDVEDNALTRLAIDRRMPQLRVLRVSGNVGLRRVDVAWTPRVRTLYADRCSIASVHGLDSASELQRLSLRQQHVRLRAPLDNPPSLQRLFLSGNALTGADVLRMDAPSLVYLELAGCQLTAMAPRLQRQTPALRSLNVDHNHLASLPRLDAWPRLKRVSCVGCQIGTLEELVQSVADHQALCVLDARTNPATLGFYPPVLIPVGAEQPEDEMLPPVPNPAIVQPDTAAAADAALAAERAAAQALADRSQFHKRTMLVPPQPSAAPRHAASAPRATALFTAADERFAATLPEPIARKRIVYRGLCGMACPTLTWLDGLELAEADVDVAERYLKQADM